MICRCAEAAPVLRRIQHVVRNAMPLNLRGVGIELSFALPNDEADQPGPLQ
jgi:hypothetical protein